MENSPQAFLYLAVLVSIIFGLAIQQVLLGYRDLILARERVTLFAPVLVWSVLLLLVVAQNWWESFGLAGRQDWAFAAFGTILLQAVIIFMLAAVVFPQDRNDAAIDLKAHYLRERRAFYLIAMAYVVSSPVRALVVDRTILPVADLAFHGVFLAAFALLAVFRNVWLHQILVPLIFASFIAYIATMTPVLVGG